MTFKCKNIGHVELLNTMQIARSILQLHAGAAAPQSTWEPVAPAGLPAAHIPEGGGLLSMFLSEHTEQRIPAVFTHACFVSR